MKSRFQPRLHHSILSGTAAARNEVGRLPDSASRNLSGLLTSFEKEPSVETSIFGISASGIGLLRLVIRDHALPGNILRIGLFGGLESSGVEVIPHLALYLENTLRRKKNLRAEIRSYPLAYPSAWFPGAGAGRESLLPELWSGSLLPEAYYFERELAVYRFNLAITLHLSNDDKIHLESSSRVIRDELLVPVRLAALKQFPGSTETFAPPSLRKINAAKLISTNDMGSSSLEIALRVPADSDPRLSTKILEELEQQYPALLAYQAFI